MPQLKVVCLAHPAEWSDKLSGIGDIKQKFLSLDQSSKSWVDLKGEIGTRMGVYKVEDLDKENCILVRIINERNVREDYSSVEEILSQEDCLPDGYEIPRAVPTASNAFLFFDLNEGVCYVYTDTTPPPQDVLAELLSLIGEDTVLSLNNFKIFEWEEQLITTVTDVALKEGFQSYKVLADLDTVKVSAVGDLIHNEKWDKVRDSLDSGEWKTIAYVKSRREGMFVFGMTKTRNKVITMPQTDTSFPIEELFERIKEMRRIVEKALGVDIRQYCFPDATLSRFI